MAKERPTRDTILLLWPFLLIVEGQKGKLKNAKERKTANRKRYVANNGSHDFKPNVYTSGEKPCVGTWL
jgi:hypothetical protein